MCMLTFSCVFDVDCYCTVMDHCIQFLCPWRSDLYHSTCCGCSHTHSEIKSISSHHKVLNPVTPCFGCYASTYASVRGIVPMGPVPPFTQLAMSQVHFTFVSLCILTHQILVISALGSCNEDWSQQHWLLSPSPFYN